LKILEDFKKREFTEFLFFGFIKIILGIKKREMKCFTALKVAPVYHFGA